MIDVEKRKLKMKNMHKLAMKMIEHGTPIKECNLTKEQWEVKKQELKATFLKKA
jgi:hypothetical protein